MKPRHPNYGVHNKRIKDRRWSYLTSIDPAEVYRSVVSELVSRNEMTCVELRGLIERVCAICPEVKREHQMEIRNKVCMLNFIDKHYNIFEQYMNCVRYDRKKKRFFYLGELRFEDDPVDGFEVKNSERIVFPEKHRMPRNTVFSPETSESSSQNTSSQITSSQLSNVSSPEPIEDFQHQIQMDLFENFFSDI